MSERLRAHPSTRPATREDIAGLEILEGLDGEFLDWFISTMAKFRPLTQQIRNTLESAT